MVLASDGLWDFLEDAEAVEIVDNAVKSGRGDQVGDLIWIYICVCVCVPGGRRGS